MNTQDRLGLKQQLLSIFHQSSFSNKGCAQQEANSSKYKRGNLQHQYDPNLNVNTNSIIKGCVKSHIFAKANAICALCMACCLMTIQVHHKAK
jgi:hypothetical protein